MKTFKGMYMKTIFKIIFVITALVDVASAQAPLLNRVGTTIYPWRAGDKFSDSLLSANAALLSKNNIFTGGLNTFNAINSGAITSTGQISAKIGVFGTGMNVALKPLGANKFDGTEIFSVDTVGNVALSLNSKLYLSGFTNDYFLQFSSGKTTLAGGNQAIDGVDIKGGGFIDLYTRNTTRLRVDSSGNVGIGANAPSSTAKFTVKSGATANIQEWYRSTSNTVIASIDTNAVFTLAPDGANNQPIIALKGRGGSNEQYSAWVTTANAKIRTNPSFEVLNGSSNPNTGSSSFLVDNSGLVSIGIPMILNTARFQVKSFTNHPNIQEWYRAGSSTAVAVVDTVGNIKGTKFFVTSINADPINATDAGTAGEIRFASGYIYVCTATNTWKRVAISSW